MYKLLCQLFLAVIGQNLPEEVFEGTLFWFLQGKRSSRQVIDLNVKQFSLTTPHQLEILGWPKEYIEARTSKGINKVYSIVKCSMFKLRFHIKVDTTDPSKYNDYSPCHRYIKLWSKDGISKVKVILYFTTREALDTTKELIKLHGSRNEKLKDKKVSYKLEAKDRSQMSCCSFCSKFMPCLSERLYPNDIDADVFEECRNYNDTISDKDDWNHRLSNIPICVECLYSKDRQGSNRMNMYNYRRFKFGDYNYTPEDRHRCNLEQSLSTEKPDMSIIPHYDNLSWSTPLDYGCSYHCLLDEFSVFYWHPELSADEYMRYQEYQRNKILEDVDPLDDEFYPDDDGYPSDDFDDYGEYPDGY